MILPARLVFRRDFRRHARMEEEIELKGSAELQRQQLDREILPLPMSHQNVEVARKAIVAWNAGDMDRLRELYDPDAVMRYAVSNWPEPGPFLGRDAIMRQFSWLRDTWDADSLDLVGDPFAAGDRVVVRAIWRAAGRGPDTDLEIAWIYTLRRGLIVSAEFFQDHAEALEAAGLQQ